MLGEILDSLEEAADQFVEEVSDQTERLVDGVSEVAEFAKDVTLEAKEVVSDVVEVAGEVAREHVHRRIEAVSEIPAVLIDAVAGDGNELSDSLREVGEGARETADVVLDNAALPIATKLAQKPLTTVERGSDLVGGLAKADLERAGTAAFKLGVSELTGGAADAVEAVVEPDELVE